MSQTPPQRCTGMIAAVRGVTAAVTASGSMRPSRRTSAKTGVAPVRTIAAVEATKEFGGVMTSSPIPPPHPPPPPSPPVPPAPPTARHPQSCYHEYTNKHYPSKSDPQLTHIS